MNRQDLVRHIASSAGITNAQADKALRSTIDAVQSTLAEGGSLSLIGFGTFSVANRGARKGKNPRTGEAIDIPARNVARFAPGKAFRDLLNGSSNGNGNGKKGAAKGGAKSAAKGGAAKAGAATKAKKK